MQYSFGRLLFPSLAMVFGWPAAFAQTSVNSNFLPPAGFYSVPGNWAPSEVPNDTEERHYNVVLATRQILKVDTDATISNLALADAPYASVSVSGRTFTVTGNTTSAGRNSLVVYSPGTDPSVFDAGALSTFTNGALTGPIVLQSDAAGAATLRFRGAHVTALQGANLVLTGAATYLTDENGNDALADLAIIDPLSELQMDGRSLAISAPLTVEGILKLGQYSTEPSILTLTSTPLNFDPASRTFSRGTFMLGDAFTGSQTGANELRFSGADIVNNASNVSLTYDTSRITDLAGLDGFRNFARNLPEGVLALTYRTLVVPGNFTNDGMLSLSGSNFTTVGTLTNFDPTSRTLQSGSYELVSRPSTGGPSFRFANADIVRNSAFLSLAAGATIADSTGNDALRNFSENLTGGTVEFGLGQVFHAGASFTNSGALHITGFQGFFIPEEPPPPDAAFSVPRGASYRQTAGETVNDGSLTADHVVIDGGSLSGYGTIDGNVTVGSANVTPAGVINGDLTLGEATHLECSIGRYSEITSWKTISGDVHLAGTLDLSVTYENYLGSDVALAVLEAGGVVTGTFSNAPPGTRINSLDGSTSFVVIYEQHSLKLTGFQANTPTAQLLNISTRGSLKAGNDSFGRRFLIAGFIITGTQPKTVVLRGLGGSLAAAGVGRPLPNPVLELHDSLSSRPIATNDDWSDTQQQEIQETGLAPTDRRESAIKATLAPGSYTVILQEKDGLPGDCLIEVYDLSPDTSKLANISTRGYVEPGGALIGGIIAGGAGQANADLVARAIQLRYSDAWFTPMGNPTLELRDGNGQLVGSSDDGQQSGAAGPVPRDFQNAAEALHVSLPPGPYTALVRDKNGGGGTTLVEFYDLRR